MLTQGDKMRRFLEKNAEVIVVVCVVLSLLLGGVLYLAVK